MAIALRRSSSNLTTTLSSPVIDWGVNTLFEMSISTNTTFIFSNATDGKTIVVKVINTTAGALTLTWPSAATGASTTVSANKTKIFTFIKMNNGIYASSMEY